MENNHKKSLWLKVIICVITLVVVVGLVWCIIYAINKNNSSPNGTLLKNVRINTYAMDIVTIETSNGKLEDYELGVDNSQFFYKLKDYENYITLNIYYNKKGSNKTIVDYKIYLKSTNEDISSVSNENELREKIGLYSIGTHTETMTLKKSEI